jgi:hypothetical protein
LGSDAGCAAYEQQLADADRELTIRELEDGKAYRTIVGSDWGYFESREYIVTPDGQVYRLTELSVCDGRICKAGETKQEPSRWDVPPTAISLGSFSASADGVETQLGFAAEVEHHMHALFSVRAGGLWAPLGVQLRGTDALWDNVGGYVGGGVYLHPPSSQFRLRLGVGFGMMQSRLLEGGYGGDELASVTTPIMIASGTLGLSPTESIELFASPGTVVLLNYEGLSYEDSATVGPAWLSFSAGLRYRFSPY